MERRTLLIGSLAAGGLLTACASGPSSSTGGEPVPGAEITPTSEVPVGGGVVNVDLAVVVTQPAAGDYKAFTAVCPHEGCLVSSVQANEILCACHGSRFSAVDGSVINGPATEGLAAAKVAVEGDAVTLA
jgi:Rieske Fe-S protein